MAMVLARIHCMQTFGRRLTMPSTFTVRSTSFNGIRLASHSSGSSSTEPPANTGDIKYPFKVVPMEVKNPEEYNVLPDPVEMATGLEKKQLLARLQGDDRYEAKIFKMRAGTKDDPNLIPSHLEARIVGCICEPDQQFVNYMWLRKDQMKRCSCGHWFKLVDAEPDLF